MWNGTALILKARPASMKVSPNSAPFERPAWVAAAIPS